jgi:hypothetical protein
LYEKDKSNLFSYLDMSSSSPDSGHKFLVVAAVGIILAAMLITTSLIYASAALGNNTTSGSTKMGNHNFSSVPTDLFITGFGSIIKGGVAFLTVAGTAGGPGTDTTAGSPNGYNFYTDNGIFSVIGGRNIGWNGPALITLDKFNCEKSFHKQGQYSFSANSLSISGTNARTVQKVSAVGWANESSAPGQYRLCIVGVYSSKP